MLSANDEWFEPAPKTADPARNGLTVRSPDPTKLPPIPDVAPKLLPARRSPAFRPSILIAGAHLDLPTAQSQRFLAKTLRGFRSSEQEIGDKLND